MPKSEDSFRETLNVKSVNQNMPYIHFKNGDNKVLTLVTPNCYMENVDVDNSYYFVRILLEHENYLKFYFRGKSYQFIISISS